MTRVLLRPIGAKDPIEVMLKRRSSDDGSAYEVAAGGHHAHVAFEATGPGGGWLRSEGRIIPFRALRKKDMLELWMGGRTYVFEIISSAARRAAGVLGANAIGNMVAPMPGTILQINVKPGDAFEANAPLIVMESMKMELALSAPHAGRVSEVVCRQRQVVEMGAVLVKFFEDPHAGTP